jgi:hypothetical protein
MITEGKCIWEAVVECDIRRAYEFGMGAREGGLESDELHMIPFRKRSYGVYKHFILGIYLCRTEEHSHA